MLDDLVVRDIYTRIEDYPNISLDAPIGHAITLMHGLLRKQSKFRTILVLDDDDHLKGYLSLRDLIRAVGPDYLKKDHPDIKGHQPFKWISQDLSSLALIWQEGFTLKVKEELKKPVSQYLTLIEDQVNLDDPIAKCIYLLLFRDVLILPVLQDGSVVGVVRLIDLFDRIADTVEEAWFHKQDKR